MKTLMVSVSGIRGIIGAGLDPHTIVDYTSAYADFCGGGKIVIGNDGRISRDFVKHLVVGTLIAKGLEVIDIGICPTPTVLFNVKKLNAQGGISISASHNPNEWNALKLLNASGEFMTGEENKSMLNNLKSAQNNYRTWDKLGKYVYFNDGLKNHIEAVLGMKLIDLEKIKERKFKVLLDCVNGAGSYVMPWLLEKLGCEVVKIDCEKNGIFPRLPEPIPQNLGRTMEAVKKHNVDLGIVVDPDVDRLVLIMENGEPFNEEYTIAQAVKFVLSKIKGNVVVNLSTTRAVDDIAKEFNSAVFRSAVGEANVVKKMKEVKAIIGGEGSGGVIYPAVHYGRDALVGTALTLQHLAEFGGTLSQLKKSLPAYFISKRKIELGDKNPGEIIDALIFKYKNENINTEDGLRIDFDDHWVHFRKSNTEPILRIYTEALSQAEADNYSLKYFEEVKSINIK